MEREKIAISSPFDQASLSLVFTPGSGPSLGTPDAEMNAPLYRAAEP